MRNKARLFMVSMCVISSLSFAADRGDENPALSLKIGRSDLRNSQIEIRSDILYSLSEGKALDFKDMIEEIETSPFVYVGETHDNQRMHNLQAEIIRSLVEKGIEIVIGVEMISVSFQDVLDRWWQGQLTKEEFIQESLWYEKWNLNFGYYEDIFVFSRENRIPMVGLNAPRDLISKIRMMGWEALSDEEKQVVPRPDLTHQEHRLLIRTIFENTDLPPQMKGPGLDMMFEGLYRAQSAWDEVMAENAVSAYRSMNRTVVVLAGSGHFLYNLGINRRVFERTGLPYKTVLGIVIPEDREKISVSRSLADYVLGIPEEEHTAFPSAGLSFKVLEDMTNPFISRTPQEGPGKAAGFEKGDIILTVNGKTHDSVNELRHYLSRFGWGDRVSFRVLRKGEIKELVLNLQPPDEHDDQDEG